MSEKPWFPFYVSDFLKETMGFTCAEIGGYMRLCVYYWEHLQLPEDDQKLSRIAGMRIEDWRRSKAAIGGAFGPGWRHARLDSAHRRWLEKVNHCKAASQLAVSARSAAVIPIGHQRARAQEVRNKNLREGESESSSSSLERGCGGEGESQESPNVAESRAMSRHSQPEEQPQEAIEGSKPKRPDQMTATEYLAAMKSGK